MRSNFLDQLVRSALDHGRAAQGSSRRNLDVDKRKRGGGRDGKDNPEMRLHRSPCDIYLHIEFTGEVSFFE